MKRDRVDKLLQLAYLEGQIYTRKAYERSVATKKTSVRVSAASRSALQRRLGHALGPNAQEEVPLTVGAFLKSVRSKQSLRAQEIFSRLGLTQNIYRMLEEDRISPLKVSGESWKLLRAFFNLPVDDLAEMIRRTHQLVFFRPAFRMTLARYDKRKSKALKARTLEKAATEMYTRAQLPLPNEERVKLDKLIKAIGE